MGRKVAREPDKRRWGWDLGLSSICPNCKLYLSTLKIVFVHIENCIFPNCKIRKVVRGARQEEMGVGSWAEEDIARIAGWRISCAVRLYHTILQSLSTK